MNQSEKRDKQSRKEKRAWLNKVEFIKGKLFLIAIVLLLIYFFVSPYIVDYYIKSNGVCAKALLTSDVARVRYHKDELKYSLIIDGTAYDGNSLETDLGMAGDSICVLYIESNPSKSRPIKYFDGDIGRCSCTPTAR